MNIIDFILILSNLTIFIVVQILFFNFIMSKLTFKIIKRNFGKIKHLIPDYTVLEVDKSQINQIKNKQYKNNLNIIIKNIVYPIVGLVCLILILTGISVYKNRTWYTYYFKLLFLIIFAYITEFMIYYLVIDKFEYMNIYKAIKIILGKNKDIICLLFNRNNQNIMNNNLDGIKIY